MGIVCVWCYGSVTTTIPITIPMRNQFSFTRLRLPFRKKETGMHGAGMQSTFGVFSQGQSHWPGHRRDCIGFAFWPRYMVFMRFGTSACQYGVVQHLVETQKSRCAFPWKRFQGGGINGTRAMATQIYGIKETLIPSQELGKRRLGEDS